MLNFFERQDRSRKSSQRLVALFVIAVAAIICSVYFALKFLIYVFDVRMATRSYMAPAAFTWYDPQLFCWIAGITVCIIGIGSLVRIRALAGGGGYVAEGLGGRLINPDTTDTNEKRLLNVVEEMSIASGVPVPLVYVMDREESINAFAAGYEPSGAVVAVTRGCLTRLKRDELQSVIAHEFSHILCGDMRLNVRLIGLLAGIVCISSIGGILMRVRGKGSAPVFFAGLALLSIGYVGVFFGRIIQCAVSRQREFLADASAVQFTRNPLGLAAALKKIGGFSSGSCVGSPEAGEACHMFFASAIKSMFATHPPLAQRILLLDPGFKGEFPDVDSQAVEPAEQQDILAQQDVPVSRAACDPSAVAGSVGTVTPEQLNQGRQMLGSIPEKLKAALAGPLGASAAVCCLLLDADSEKRGAQIRGLRAVAAQPLISELLRLAPVITGIEAAMRLPALDLALPALRQLSAQQYRNLAACVKFLVEADGRVTLFEFCLYMILTRRLGVAFGAARPRQAKLGQQEFLGHAAVLLSALAHAGHGAESQAREAFAAGAACLKAPAAGVALLPPARAAIAAVGTALNRCAAAPGELKQRLLEACAHCALHDKDVTVSEAELLRAFAYCLDLPLPPVLSRP